MSVWGVSAEKVRYELTYEGAGGARHPFWVEVKKFLNVGEERRVMTAGWRGIATGGEDGGAINIDWRAQTFARAAAYLTDWSLQDDAGNKLAMSRDVIESLNPEVYGLIETQIRDHIESVAQEKKLPSGSEPPSAMSA